MPNHADFDGVEFEKTANLKSLEAKKNMSNNVETFTPETDVIETLADGRTIQVAAAGVPVPLTEAERLGLLKVQDTETIEDGSKAVTPNANKAKTPKSNK